MLSLPIEAATVLSRLHDEHGIVGGFDLACVDPDRRNEMLVAVTEMNTRDDIDCFVDAVRSVLAKHSCEVPE